ncbi:NLR family CARD domain-containing protein 3 [Geodia barretti]|uniref:NLR family CARD domain-containing protein 3 n=1 Tax=Geodia barretti TaxID=519541 RepID=A0AA35SSI0_GEOBA|nr:NLR family CARD domain-containing protein 3 [Geodia barretti]
MATMLKTNSSLERLHLRRCDIGSSGGVELGAALEKNKTLRCLDLSGNALGDDGVRGLCVGLGNNSSLEELELIYDESLGEEGVSLLLQLQKRKQTETQEMLPPTRPLMARTRFIIYCDMLRHPEASQGSLPLRLWSVERKASKGTEKMRSRQSFSSLSTGTLSEPLYKKIKLSEETETTMSGSSVSQSTRR